MGQDQDSQAATVWVVETREDDTEPFTFGTVWATFEAAVGALNDDCATLNAEDPEACATVVADANGAGATREAYGYVDATVRPVEVQA